MQRNARSAIPATLATLMALAGCGGGGSGSDATTAAPGPTPVATPAPAPAPAPAPIPAPAPAPAPGLSAASLAILNLDIARLPSYTPVLPVHYDAAATDGDNTPLGSPAGDAMATLGRVLFYDKQLSINGTVSCASCHQQAVGFGDSRRFSVGFSGTAFTTAHSMRLGNVRYFAPGTMFWDRRASTLESQATQPIQHPVEMGFDAANGGMPALLARMRGLPYYPELFTLAWGTADINETRIQQALAAFQRAMVSAGSRWDSAYAQVFNPAQRNASLNLPLPGFTAAENRGRQLFVAGIGQGGAGCAACHQPPTFALAGNSRSNGLDAGETTVFKSPSLKNAALSAAFMHDGRFSTLEQVVEHYNSGVQNGPALDNRLRGPNNQPQRLNLSEADKAALAAFLRTLTDDALVRDPRFASPFR